MAKTNIEKVIINLLEKMDRQHSDVDKRLDNIEKVMLAQEINLQTHMKRSDTLEALYKEMQEKDIKPLNKHKDRIDGGLKAIGIISLFLGIVYTFLQLFHVI